MNACYVASCIEWVRKKELRKKELGSETNFAVPNQPIPRRNYSDGTMMHIDPSETMITGKWSMRDGKLVADDACRRINALVRQSLKELGRDASGWDALYLDPVDGRLWELVYPQSELHGGGPPQLRNLTKKDARQKYGDLVDAG